MQIAGAFTVICSVQFYDEYINIKRKVVVGKINFIQHVYTVSLALCCLDSYHVSRGQAKVDDDGGKCEEVAGAVVFMDPAADLLQW